MSILDKIKKAGAAASAALMADTETEPVDPKAPFRTVDEIMAAMRERTGLDRELTTIGAHRQFIFNENRTPDEKRIIGGWIRRAMDELNGRKGNEFTGALAFFTSLEKAIEPVSKKSNRVQELDGQIFESMAKIEQFKVVDSQLGIEADIIRKPKYYFLVENKKRVIELLVALGHESVVKTEPDIDTGNNRSFGTFHKTWESYFKDVVEKKDYSGYSEDQVPLVEELAGYVLECTITTAKNFKAIKK